MPYFESQTLTKTRRKADPYMKLAAQFLGNNRELSGQFRIFEKKMKNLNRNLDRLYTANEKGAFPLLSEEENLEPLKKDYETCYLSAMAMMEHCRNAGVAENSPAWRSIDAVAKFLAADRRTLDQYRPSSRMSLPEFIRSRHTSYVDLTNTEMKHVGGNVSSRIPMKVKIQTLSGKNIIVPGMFTEETKSDIFSAGDKVMEAIDRNPVMQDLYRACGQNAGRMMDLLSRMDVDRDDAGDVRHVTVPGDVPGDAAEALRRQAAQYNFNEGSRKLIDQLIPYAEMLQNARMSRAIQQEARIPRGANIDRRNCAMSAVSGLLGMSDLIAEAVPMTVKTEDGYKKGTFMQFAKGSDIGHLTRKDNMMKITKQSYKNITRNTPGLIQASDLQVLDFICGNTDRHNGNVFYQVSDKGHLRGIQGIDNDLSFGLLEEEVLTGDQPRQYFTGLKSMKFITEETANKIVRITPQMLSTTISGFGLSQQEIAAACHRLDLLKKALNFQYFNNPQSFQPENLENDSKLYVLKAEQVKQLHLEHLALTRGIEKEDGTTSKIGANLFGTIARTMREMAMNKEAHRDELEDDDRTKDFVETAVRNRVQKPDIAKYADKMAEHLQTLKQVDKGIIFSSPEFSNVLHYTEYVAKELRTMAGREDEASIARTYHMFENLNALNTMYLDHKDTDGTLGRNAHSQNRAMAVTGLQEMVGDYVGRFGLSDRDQYRHLCQKQRLGVFDRRHDTASIAASIRRLTENRQVRDREAGDPGEMMRLEGDFTQLIDGIGAKGWKKTLDDYADTAGTLLEQLKENDYFSEEMYDAVRDLKETLTAVRDPEYLAPASGRKGQDVMNTVKDKLKAVSDCILEGMKDEVNRNRLDISSVWAMQSLADLSENAGEENPEPLGNIRRQIAKALLVRTAEKTEGQLINCRQRMGYKTELNYIEERLENGDLLRGRSEDELKIMLRSDKAMDKLADKYNTEAQQERLAGVDLRIQINDRGGSGTNVREDAGSYQKGKGLDIRALRNEMRL